MSDHFLMVLSSFKVHQFNNLLGPLKKVRSHFVILQISKRESVAFGEKWQCVNCNTFVSIHPLPALYIKRDT